MTSQQTIPEQISVPWGTAFFVSWTGVKRRLLRSLITMIGVVLAIAFLSYMLTFQNITNARVEVNDNALNVILQEAGVDILARTTDQMLVLLLGLSMLTSTVGIVNSMLMSVSERVREIGTMKCLGAGDQFIVRIYFIESTLQGILGAVLGMILGCLVGIGAAVKTYGAYAWWHFPALSVAGAVGISFLCGSLISVVAAIGPAYVAARKQPVEALRVEE